MTDEFSTEGGETGESAMETVERIRDDLARQVVEKSKRGPRRLSHTKPIGVPAWLDDLLVDAGWDTYVLAIEVGGRGALHPDLGWVSVEELRAVAQERDADGE